LLETIEACHSDRVDGIHVMGGMRRFSTTGIVNPGMVQQKEMGTVPSQSRHLVMLLR